MCLLVNHLCNISVSVLLAGAGLDPSGDPARRLHRGPFEGVGATLTLDVTEEGDSAK